MAQVAGYSSEEFFLIQITRDRRPILYSEHSSGSGPQKRVRPFHPLALILAGKFILPIAEMGLRSSLSKIAT